MWSLIRSRFERYPERLSIVRFLLRYGLGVNDSGEVHVAGVVVPSKRIADVLGVDRRTVKVTARELVRDPGLRPIFRNLEPAGPSLKRVARNLGLSVLEVEAVDPREPGILAGVAGAVASEGISIRQAIAEDPFLYENPRLILVLDRPPPAHVLSSLRSLEGILSIKVY